MLNFFFTGNPPTDIGRKLLSNRFLRHISVVYVDYPDEASLKQIYGALNWAMLKNKSDLKMFNQGLTDAMIDVYLKSQKKFTSADQPHYIYSPREIKRWVIGMNTVMSDSVSIKPDDFLCLFIHEGLRIFYDRLVTAQEREVTYDFIVKSCKTHLLSKTDLKVVQNLEKTILFSNWLSVDKKYENIKDITKLKDCVRVKNHLSKYNSLNNVQLVLYDDAYDHLLRIDRILRQPQGHLLLIGVSGSGRKTLTKFVAFMCDLKLYEIKMHNNYNSANFDADLRNVLKIAGKDNEKTVLIIDESNLVDSSFIERMSTLLANGEVLDLFEGEDYSILMKECQSKANIESFNELHKWFTKNINQNLHVVFTVNPSQNGLQNRAKTSPALFNRCVVNWLGDWSHQTLVQVATQKLENHDSSVADTLVKIHDYLRKLTQKLQEKGKCTITVTPTGYLDFIDHFIQLYEQKESELKEQIEKFKKGLNIIQMTKEDVENQKTNLENKKKQLDRKNGEIQTSEAQIKEKEIEQKKKQIELKNEDKDLEVKIISK